MSSEITPDAELDCVGLYCPMPIAMTKEEIEKIEVLKFEKEGTILTFYIRRTK
jgi:tRNA 2-thiouridine synthesizing protein A